MCIGICTRFGCATTSCTCTDPPLPSGFGGIFSILKLARFLQQRVPFENTRQFHSLLFSAILCEEVVEWLLQNTVEIEDYPLDNSSQIRVARPCACKQISLQNTFPYAER